jgi:hypothetical protein
MKYVIHIIGITLLSKPVALFAQAIKPPSQYWKENVCGKLGVCRPSNGENLIESFARVTIETILLMIGGLCVIVIIYGGIRLMLSGISDGKEHAKKALMIGIVGLLLSIFAGIIVSSAVDIIT